MPATSQQQQKLMGLVHALQKGTVKPGQASKKAQQMAKSMKKSDVTDFAATKHKGLPKKAKKENMGVASMYVVRKPHSDMNEAGDWLDKISNKIFLAAPITQVFLFISPESRYRLFAKNSDGDYDTDLKLSKSKLLVLPSKYAVCVLTLIIANPDESTSAAASKQIILITSPSAGKNPNSTRVFPTASTTSVLFLNPAS